MPAAAPNKGATQPSRQEFGQQQYQNKQSYDPYAREQREERPQTQNFEQRNYDHYQQSSQTSTHPSRVSPSALKQLELRAIFGVNHELTREEIIQRARTLPGVRNVAIVGDSESRALQVLKESISRLGFGDAELLSLNASSGNVDFIHEIDSTLAVLHEGDYAPGVRETLIIVTRELGRAS